jgi:hypothetical protein
LLNFSVLIAETVLAVEIIKKSKKSTKKTASKPVKGKYGKSGAEMQVIDSVQTIGI